MSQSPPRPPNKRKHRESEDDGEGEDGVLSRGAKRRGLSDARVDAGAIWSGIRAAASSARAAREEKKERKNNAKRPPPPRPPPHRHHRVHRHAAQSYNGDNSNSDADGADDRDGDAEAAAAAAASASQQARSDEEKEEAAAENADQGEGPDAAADAGEQEADEGEEDEDEDEDDEKIPEPPESWQPCATFEEPPTDVSRDEHSHFCFVCAYDEKNSGRETQEKIQKIRSYALYCFARFDVMDACDNISRHVAEINKGASDGGAPIPKWTTPSIFYHYYVQGDGDATLKIVERAKDKAVLVIARTGVLEKDKNRPGSVRVNIKSVQLLDKFLTQHSKQRKANASFTVIKNG